MYRPFADAFRAVTNAALRCVERGLCKSQERHAKRLGQARDHANRGVARAALLDFPDVALREAGAVGDLLQSRS